MQILMDDFNIINLEELTNATALSGSDLVGIAQGNKSLNKLTIQNLASFIGVNASVVVGDKNTEPSVPSFAFAEQGTYIEWGNQTITSDLGILIYDGTSFSKTEINFIANGIVEQGNTNAVSGGKVYDWVKSLVAYDDLTNDVIKESIATNGNIITNSQVDTTLPISVKLGDVIEYKGSLSNSLLAIAGYSSEITNSSTFVESILVGGTYTSIQQITITNPNVKYIRLSSRNSTYPNVVQVLYAKKKSEVITELKEDIKEIQDNQIDPNININITGVKTNNLVIRSDNGNTVSLISSGFPDTEFTDFIEVNSTDDFIVSGWFGSSNGIAGYDENKVYNSRLADSSTASVNRVEIANSYKLTIPSNVKYVRGGTKDRNTYPFNISKQSNIRDVVIENNESIEEIKSNFKESIIVNFVSPTNFTVTVNNKENGSSVVHNFIRKVQINSFESVVNMVTEDIWYPNSIIVNGATIAQGNLNFIYMIYATGDKAGENGHVGAGHGCIVQKWTKFYVDGKEFNPNAQFIEIVGQSFSFKSYADCYAINKVISPSGENGLPKLDIENNPIIANNNSIDATYYANGIIEHRNRLHIKRDNTSFTQCHAAMNSCFRPYFDKVLFPNSTEFTLNNHYVEEGAIVVNPIDGSSINTFTTDRFYSNEITQFGADGYSYILKNTILNMDNSKQKNANIHFYYGLSPNWLKVYMQPIICRDSPDGATPEVFNDGDVIDILVKREVLT